MSDGEPMKVEEALEWLHDMAHGRADWLACREVTRWGGASKLDELAQEHPRFAELLGRVKPATRRRFARAVAHEVKAAARVLCTNVNQLAAAVGVSPEDWLLLAASVPFLREAPASRKARVIQADALEEARRAYTQTVERRRLRGGQLEVFEEQILRLPEGAPSNERSHHGG